MAELARGDQLSEKRKRFREQFQAAIVLGVILLTVNMLIPEYRRNNKSQEVDK